VMPYSMWFPVAMRLVANCIDYNVVSLGCGLHCVTCIAVGTASSDTSSVTTATQSLSSSIDTPMTTTTAFIAQARHRGDGQDVDNTTSSSDTQYAPPTAVS